MDIIASKEMKKYFQDMLGEGCEDTSNISQNFSQRIVDYAENLKNRAVKSGVWNHYGSSKR